MPRPPAASKSVFINCPFDDGYKPMFQALVFTVCALGFAARCARESDDSGEVRITKINRIIEQCKYGIHDISEVRLDPINHLPRFNMPLELGLYLGCREFGGNQQRKKVTLILDVEPHRYQKCISDIAGQDIRAHGNDPERAVVAVRNWLATASRHLNMPGGASLANDYRRFSAGLPALCDAADLDLQSLTFRDLSALIVKWLQTSR